MGFKDHFSGHAAAYAQARPRYPDAWFDWLSALAPGGVIAACGYDLMEVSPPVRWPLFARVGRVAH